MGKSRLKSGMIDFGEFFKLKDGRSIFKCKTCKEQLEIENLNLFISHIKENHPIQNISIISNTKTDALADKDDSNDTDKKSSECSLLTSPKFDKRIKESSLNIFKKKQNRIPKLKIQQKNEICDQFEDSLKTQSSNFFGFENKIKIDNLNVTSDKINGSEVKFKQSAVNWPKDNSFNNNFCHIKSADFSNNLDEDDLKFKEIFNNYNREDFECDFASTVIVNKTGSEIVQDLKQNGSKHLDNQTSKKTIDAKYIRPEELKLNKDQIYLTECDYSEFKILKKYEGFKKSEICCEKCENVYKKRSTLVKHLEGCKGPNKITKSREKQSSKIKIKIKNENEMYQCSNCKLEFSLLDELESHEKLHSLKNMKQQTQCEVCGKYLKSITSLNLHKLRHSGRSPFKCATCDRGFYNKYTLASHKQIHNSEKEYKCEHCDKEYGRYVDLKRHVRYSHLKEKPNPVMCDLCGKSFSFAFNLKYHMRRHLNVKPVKCDKCDMTFVERGDLNKHLITHNPDYKPFACEICSKSFSRKITLTKHQKLHTGLKEYICKICGKAFAQSPGLYMHMKTHGFNIKPEGAGYYERQSHLLFRNMNSDRANLT